MSDGTGPQWRKSGFSKAGDCVQWRFTDDAVLVSNSRDPDGASLSFTHSEWRAFLQAVRAGEADFG